MTFARLKLPDWVAFVAALALVLVMAMTWYTTKTGEQLRRDAKLALPAGVVNGEIYNFKQQDAQAAAKFEKNAWHDDALIGRLILLALLASFAAAVIAGFARAAGHRFKGRLTPSAIASIAGAAAVLMIAYRILQPPGWNPGAVVKSGAPLALLCVAILALAERVAVHYERDGTAWASEDVATDPIEPLATSN